MLNFESVIKTRKECGKLIQRIDVDEKAKFSKIGSSSTRIIFKCKTNTGNNNDDFTCHFKIVFDRSRSNENNTVEYDEKGKRIDNSVWKICNNLFREHNCQFISDASNFILNDTKTGNTNQNKKVVCRVYPAHEAPQKRDDSNGPTRRLYCSDCNYSGNEDTVGRYCNCAKYDHMRTILTEEESCSVLLAQIAQLSGK